MKLSRGFYFKFIGIFIFCWLIYQIDIFVVIDVLKRVSFINMGWAIILMLVHFLLKIIRFRFILSQQIAVPSFARLVQISMAASFLSFVTPGRVGELSRAFFLRKSDDVPFSKLIAGNIVDRIFDVYLLLFIAFFGLASNHIFGPHTVKINIIFGMIIVVSLLIIIFNQSLMNIAKKLQNRFFRNRQWENHMQILVTETFFLLKQKTTRNIVFTLFAYLAFFYSCFFLAQSLAIDVSFIKLSFFVACANILSFLPISFAGFGTREATLVFLFATENVTTEIAFAFSTLIFTVTYLLFGIIGFICYMNLKDVKKSVGLKNA